MRSMENLENTQNKIRISVAMTTYNGEKFVKEQIQSILACLNCNDELVISDDGSTDRTLQIIEEFALADERIKLIEGPKQGVVKNFENALMHCGGEYIFLSDQDDLWHSDKVSTVLPLLENYLLVCHNANIYDYQADKIVGDVQSKIGTHGTVFKNIVKNSFIGCCMAFRKELLSFTLPFPDPELIHMHDWWLGLIALKKGKVYFEKNCLMDYRIHGGNTVGFQKTSFAFKIKKRTRMLKALRKRKMKK